MIRESRREALEQTKTTIWGCLVSCYDDEADIAFKELYKLLDLHWDRGRK